MAQPSDVPHTGENSETPSAALKILVADDQRLIRKILEKTLGGEGREIVFAENGEEAVAAFERESPDLVIMDIMMPVMDGYEATRTIKEKAGESFVPVIALTSLEDEESLAKCIAVGADDFLSKPFTPTILNAKIDSLMRIRALYDTVNEQKNVLGALNEEKDVEMKFAEKIYSQIVYQGSMDETNINYESSPMAIFSGDILLIARNPLGPVNVIMGDFTGHGLSAAMGAIPASDIFYAMSARGNSVNEIAMELNRKLKQLLPSNIFLAAGIVQMDSANGTATIWSGAVPDIFVLGKEGGVKNRIKSRNLPLGVVDNDTLGSTIEVIAMAPGDRLCIFSDGVTEAVRSDGEMFEEERLEECLNRHRGDHLLEAVKADVEKFCGGHSQTDDVTMVEIICDNQAARPPVAETPEVSGKSAPLDWEMVVELSPDRLRDSDPMPMIMRVLMQDDCLVKHKENLFLIMSELYTNGLDYGLLGMDGNLKGTMEGMIQYLTKREEALAAVETGSIRMEIKHTARGGERVFVVRVQDSGPGFDHTAKGPSLEENRTMGGRGIALIRSLCKEVVYHGNGNMVEATYATAQSTSPG